MLKILIVEDDFWNRKLIDKIVSPYGHIDHASDGLDAVQAVNHSILENDPYELILLDIQMPNMGGIEALRSIRNLEAMNEIPLWNGAKVIMISTSRRAQEVLSSFRYGCQSYLTKPITKNGVIEELLKLKLIHLAI